MSEPNPVASVVCPYCGHALAHHDQPDCWECTNAGTRCDSEDAHPAAVICASVEIAERRWDVRLTFRDDKGEVVREMVASADSHFTERSGIWWGTAQEYEEARDA